MDKSSFLRPCGVYWAYLPIRRSKSKSETGVTIASTATVSNLPRAFCFNGLSSTRKISSSPLPRKTSKRVHPTIQKDRRRAERRGRFVTVMTGGIGRLILLWNSFPCSNRLNHTFDKPAPRNRRHVRHWLRVGFDLRPVCRDTRRGIPPVN